MDALPISSIQCVGIKRTKREGRGGGGVVPGSLNRNGLDEWRRDGGLGERSLGIGGA